MRLPMALRWRDAVVVAQCRMLHTAHPLAAARIVLNHSTHIPGMLDALALLAKSDGITTLVPGRLTSGRTSIPVPHIQLKVTVPIMGGFKVCARKGNSIQEVFITTSLDKEALQEEIAALCGSGGTRGR